MKEKFRPYEPNQQYLFPPSPQEWLPEGHLAYFISETLDELDMSEFTDDYSSDERGEKGYHPAMMLKLLMYGYSTGVFSSRKIAKKVEEDVAFRYLAGGYFPSHRTVRRFRERHIEAFQRVFVEVVGIAREAELIKLGVLAIDGTKVKANASKHRAMSYGRMLEEERKLSKEIEELLKKAEATDDGEDDEFGADRRGDEMPEELKRREKRIAVIRAAKARIEQRQKDIDSAKGRRDDDDKNASGGRSRFKRKFGVPESKAQDNFTDPESRIMKTSSGGFEQCYNAQAVVDAQAQIVVAVGITQNASDVQQLVPMMECVSENMGKLPEIILCDAGFRSEENLQAMEDKGVEAIIALGREGKKQVKTDKSLSATARLKERLATKRGEKLYRRRKAIVEPIFGIIKHVLGFREFLLRGCRKVVGEWNLVCCALNLKRMSSLMIWQ